jgi:hypothetical protein
MLFVPLQTFFFSGPMLRLADVHLCLFYLQKQSKDRFGLEGDEESTMLEESVSPKK